MSGRPSVTPQDLDGESFVGFTSELTIRRQIDRWFKQAGISVDFVHLFDNVENIKRAVEIGSGVALLPAPTVRREAETGSLFAVHIEGVPVASPIGNYPSAQPDLDEPGAEAGGASPGKSGADRKSRK